MFVIKQIGLLLLGCGILFITCMITDAAGIHLVLSPLVKYIGIDVHCHNITGQAGACM